MIARYRALFSVPGFSRLLLSSVLGRLPSGMFSLAILLFVRGRTGSFLDAGVAVGAFAIAGALIGPLLGAMVDQVGQRRVLLTAAAVQTALLAALVGAGQTGAKPIVIVALAELAGAAQPPIAGCIRALWSTLAADKETLETAYALDATAQEVIWTLGPLLVGSAAILVSPAASVLLCAAITLLGTAFFAASKVSSEWQPATSDGPRAGALSAPGLRALLATVALSGVVIGAVEIGLPALAVQAGSRSSAGPLLALFSIGSMAGGLLYSAAHWRRAIGLRYVGLLLAMALGVAPLMLTHSLLAGYLLSALAGLGVAPMLSCQFSLVGALAPAGTATEAFTWHRGATIAGMAVGSTVGGSLIDSHGAGSAFALGCAGVAGACLLAMLLRARIDPDGIAAGEPLVEDFEHVAA